MEKNILKWLQEVEHPAKGDKNIVELGMVENIEVAEGSVTGPALLPQAVQYISHFR